MPHLHRYYTYILTNPKKTVLYVGVTGNMAQRLQQHRSDAEGLRRSFAGKYNCVHLLYYEVRQWIGAAIARETEIKGWTRERKLALIREENPDMRFLETDVF